MVNAMLLLLLAYGFKHIGVVESFVLSNFNWIAMISLLLLLLFSYREQTKAVKKRVEENVKG